MSKQRVIGTSPTQLQAAEEALGRKLPPSFSNWLLSNNGRSLGALTIFPVFDSRDPRKTWDSIVRMHEETWAEWKEHFPALRDELAALLPFASFGTGHFYCFDYQRIATTGEPTVVLWSHETGEHKTVADDFAAFLALSERPS